MSGLPDGAFFEPDVTLGDKSPEAAALLVERAGFEPA